MKNIILVVLASCLLFACKNSTNSDTDAQQAATPPQDLGTVEVDALVTYSGARDASSYDVFPEMEVDEKNFHYFVKNPDSVSVTQMIVVGESIMPDPSLQPGTKVVLKGSGILRADSPTLKSIFLKEVQSMEPQASE